MLQTEEQSVIPSHLPWEDAALDFDEDFRFATKIDRVENK